MGSLGRYRSDFVLMKGVAFEKWKSNLCMTVYIVPDRIFTSTQILWTCRDIMSKHHHMCRMSRVDLKKITPKIELHVSDS